MSYTEIDVELLLLAAQDGDQSRTELKRRLREMTSTERAVLRRAVKSLNAALDEVIIEERLARIRERSQKHRPTTD